jgi:hypothetical protein
LKQGGARVSHIVELFGELHNNASSETGIWILAAAIVSAGPFYLREIFSFLNRRRVILGELERKQAKLDKEIEMKIAKAEAQESRKSAAIETRRNKKAGGGPRQAETGE